MLGYVCKYTPMELFEAMDTEITRLEPSVTDFNHADTLMHANICSYTKAVLEDVLEHDYEGVILTTSCDSIRRLYDTLKSQFPDKFFFLLDIPRKFNDFAVALYERQLKQMLRVRGFLWKNTGSETFCFHDAEQSGSEKTGKHPHVCQRSVRKRKRTETQYRNHGCPMQQ